MITKIDHFQQKKTSNFYSILTLFFFQIASGVVLLMTAFLIMYTFHCTWVTSEAYSSPSIVLSARGGDGGRIIFDDFREAYYWLWQNTKEDATVMSWWDYGYQV